jgi:hypothetical protein
VTNRSATAAELPGLRQDVRGLLREMQLCDLTADELRDMRALLRRARKRMLAGKVVPLRVARAVKLTRTYALAEPTIDELYAELERRT